MSEFSTALRTAMTLRGVTCKDLAPAVGVRSKWLSELRSGRHMPSLDLALALEEVLFQPALADSIRVARSGACEVCGSPWLSNQKATGGRRYCSGICARTAGARRVRASVKVRHNVEHRRLSMYQEAVAAFCRACEPEGMCRDSACALRPVSPLPVSERRDVGAVAFGISAKREAVA